MDEEQIDRIVESSKRIQEIAEFVNDDGLEDLFENLATSVLAIFQSMHEQTNLSDQEIAAAISGAVTSIAVSWITEYRDDD